MVRQRFPYRFLRDMLDSRRMAHKITDSCVACGTCKDECPQGAIAEGAPKYTIDQELCIDCGVCVGACPTEAIVAD